MRRVLFVAFALSLVCGSAQAAPPSNDARTAPKALGSLPVVEHGTTAEATRESSDPFVNCANGGNNVWYRFDAPSDGRIVVRLAAAGDLDAIVTVYKRVRSQLQEAGCEATSAQGRAELDFRVKRGEQYLVAVAQRTNSVAGEFDLTVIAPQPAATFPGSPLPRAGVTSQVDPLQNPDDAFAVSLRAGHTYRLRLITTVAASDDEDDEPICGTRARLYEPGSGSADDASPVRSLTCTGYTTFTPKAGEGGRYSVLVTAGRGDPQRYRLRVAAAGPDDTAPGRFVPNFGRVRGSIGGVDALDLYRFDVVRRSSLTLRVSTSADIEVQLRNDRGRVVTSGDEGEIQTQLRPGRYFAVVRSSGASGGRYTLTRSSRAITRTSVAINRKSRARATPGSSVRINVVSRPKVTGPVRVTIQRFDPVDGWLFVRRVRARVVNGRVDIPFLPASVGRWRVHAEFLGTRGAAASESGFASVLVAGKLQQ